MVIESNSCGQEESIRLSLKKLFNVAFLLLSYLSNTCLLCLNRSRTERQVSTVSRAETRTELAHHLKV